MSPIQTRMNVCLTFVTCSVQSDRSTIPKGSLVGRAIDVVDVVLPAVSHSNVDRPVTAVGGPAETDLLYNLAAFHCRVSTVQPARRVSAAS